MFAHSYSEDSHERASVNNNYALMNSSVFSWRRNDIAESSSLRSGAGSAFHVDGPGTARLHGPRNGSSSNWVLGYGGR